MRSSYAERPYEHARHLVFKSSSGAHGHRDVLSITAYAFGRELLIDPGIRSYERADVERYVQTSYHNTVCIDGSNQPRTSGKTDVWFSNPALDFVSGVFAGYPNVSHRRTILFVKPDYWLVRDEIAGGGKHGCDQNWHFAADADPTVDVEMKRARTNYSAGGNIMMVAVEPVLVECDAFEFFIAEKRMEGGKGNVPAKGVRYSASGTLPVVFNTLLYPYRGSQRPSVSAKLLEPMSESTEMLGLEITAGRRVDYLFFSRNGAVEAFFYGGRIKVDAEILIIRMLDGKPCLLGGRNVGHAVCFGETLYNEKARAVDVYLNFTELRQSTHATGI